MVGDGLLDLRQFLLQHADQSLHAPGHFPMQPPAREEVFAPMALALQKRLQFAAAAQHPLQCADLHRPRLPGMERLLGAVLGQHQGILPIRFGPSAPFCVPSRAPGAGWADSPASPADGPTRRPPVQSPPSAPARRPTPPAPQPTAGPPPAGAALPTLSGYWEPGPRRRSAPAGRGRRPRGLDAHHCPGWSCGLLLSPAACSRPAIRASRSACSAWGRQLAPVCTQARLPWQGLCGVYEPV